MKNESKSNLILSAVPCSVEMAILKGSWERRIGIQNLILHGDVIYGVQRTLVMPRGASLALPRS